MGFDEGLVTLGRLDRFAADGNRDELSDEGLMLGSGFQRLEYWCSPEGALTFASTGGDGVHFSLLDLGDGPTEASPVVMTVPSAIGDGYRPNWIVGATVLEFLSLGADGGGFFGLEQLAYDPARPAHIEDQRGGPRSPVLDRLATELDLEPWRDVAGRLETLHRRWSPSLG